MESEGSDHNFTMFFSIVYAILPGSYWFYREFYGVDSDRFHKETSTLSVQPRQVELEIVTLS